MRDTGLLIERTRTNHTYYEAKEGLHIDEVWENLPSDAMEQELLRLHQLDSEAMYVIRCAAICGSSGVEEVVYGTQLHRTEFYSLLNPSKNITPDHRRQSFSDGCFRFINNCLASHFAKKCNMSGLIPIQHPNLENSLK